MKLKVSIALSGPNLISNITGYLHQDQHRVSEDTKYDHRDRTFKNCSQFFTNNVVNEWYKLSEQVINSSLVNKLKNKYDKCKYLQKVKKVKCYPSNLS